MAFVSSAARVSSVLRPLSSRLTTFTVAESAVSQPQPPPPSLPPSAIPSFSNVSSPPRQQHAMAPDSREQQSFYRRQLPETLVDLQTDDGKSRFSSALTNGNAEAFFPLVSHFQTQSHPALCGLTSLSTVLNALQIDPKRVWSHPWRWFAESLLDCCLDMDRIKSSGMTMEQLATTARCQGSDAQVVRNLDLDQSRNLIKRSVRGNPDGSFEFLVASYDRRSLGQTGTGHFSPVAAYDHATDSVLVLDVARFKYSPHWVPLRDLVAATSPVDPSTGLPRGFLTFRKFSANASHSDVCHVTKCENDDRCARKPISL